MQCDGCRCFLRSWRLYRAQPGMDEQSKQYVGTVSLPQIVAPFALATQEYIIDSGLKSLDVHGLFTIETEPIEHNLCGDILLTPQYDGSDLPPTDSLTQVIYSSADRQFSITSTNGDLIGNDKSYSVNAQLLNYDPSTYTGVSIAKASGIINFINPCLVPFGLTAEATSSPASNNFSSDVIIQLTEFQVSPARCQVTYTCTDITRKDGTTSNIDCSDTTFEGVFDNTGKDGQLEIHAVPSSTATYF